jgi:hypothetical protein
MGAVVVLGLTTGACAPQIVKASAMADGRLLLDGRPAAGWQEQLAMTRAAWTHGAVWLYVEGAVAPAGAPEGTPPPAPTSEASPTGGQGSDDVASRRLTVTFAAPGPTAAARATAEQVIDNVERNHLMLAFAGRPDFKDLEAYPQFRRTP